MAENLERVFSGNGNQYKDQARIAEFERPHEHAHTEIEPLKHGGWEIIPLDGTILELTGYCLNAGVLPNMA